MGEPDDICPFTGLSQATMLAAYEVERRNHPERFADWPGGPGPRELAEDAFEAACAEADALLTEITTHD